MVEDIRTVEERLKSFTCQLHTECGILERLVYKHKNQHRRCSYFQYILKVRRDLKLLKSANLEEIFDAAFIVINGHRPKQKVQLLESLKRRKCCRGKYNFLERLLGVTRLLSLVVEPLLKAAMEVSTLLARSFFMKFSLTTLGVLARIRVLVQQMLLDAVHVYNTVSSLSQSEQTVKLNQDGFEDSVFREYYPSKEEATTTLECIWQTDKYILVEKEYNGETDREEKDDPVDISLKGSEIQYENIEVILGVDESGISVAEHVSSDANHAEQNGTSSEANNDAKQVLQVSDTSGASGATIISAEDSANSSAAMIFGVKSNELVQDGKTGSKSVSLEPSLPASSSPSPLSNPKKRKHEANKKVAFVSVKRPSAPQLQANRGSI